MSLGIPVVPGTPGAIETLDEAFAFTKQIGYPVMVKAVSGGGGRGMRIARSDEELGEAVIRCARV
jgi:pyruvate carboxylase